MLSGCGEGVDIGDNDGHDEVDHDQGAEDDEADQESHGEYKRQDVLVLGVIVQGVKLKLPQNHDYDLQQRFARILEVFVVASKADYKECEPKCNNHDDERNCSLDDSLRNRIKHNTEPRG